jgi:CubicO group peptidase (beta-lactamase class C family)
MRKIVVFTLLPFVACGPSLRDNNPVQKFAEHKREWVNAEEGHQREDLKNAGAQFKAVADEGAKSFPSMIIGVVHAEELVWSQGYGVRDAASKAPIDADTVFRLGSLTKVFAGAALLRLRDAGKLNFDEPLAIKLPELTALEYPTRDSVMNTARHLVTHATGFERDGGLDPAPSENLTEAQLLALAVKAKLWFAPGSRTSYSNLAMALAGPLITRASGMPFREYISRNLLGPIGMSSTFWDRGDVPAGKLAIGHFVDQTGAHEVPAHFKLGAAAAMGQLYTSLNDLSKFASFELAAWPPRDGPDDGPVHRSSLRESQMYFGSANGQTGFGVNWVILDDRDLGHVVFHNGTTGDYSATLWMVPGRKLAVVALASSGNFEALDDVAHAMLLVAGNIVPEPVPALGEPVSEALVRILALLDKPEPEAIKKAFSPKFLAGVTPEALKGTFEKVHGALGACHDHRAVRVTGPNAAIVRLQCEHGAVNLKISTSANPPYLLEALQLEPAKD